VYAEGVIFIKPFGEQNTVSGDTMMPLVDCILRMILHHLLLLHIYRKIQIIANQNEYFEQNETTRKSKEFSICNDRCFNPSDYESGRVQKR
jgi:hypothetical protein